MAACPKCGGIHAMNYGDFSSGEKVFECGCGHKWTSSGALDGDNREEPRLIDASSHLWMATLYAPGDAT